MEIFLNKLSIMYIHNYKPIIVTLAKHSLLPLFYKQISTYQKHILPGFLPPTLHTLLSKCLHSDWKNRLTPLDAMYLLG